MAVHSAEAIFATETLLQDLPGHDPASTGNKARSLQSLDIFYIHTTSFQFQA